MIEDGSECEAVLTQLAAAFAENSRHQHGSELAALLHRGEHIQRAQAHLRGFLAGLIGEAVAAGEVPADIPAAELAAFCLHALTAAGTAPSGAAVNRLVQVTLAGLRP